MAQNRFAEQCQKEDVGGQRSVTQRRRKHNQINKAMHEENFLSSWLRDAVEGRADEREKVINEAREELCKKVGNEGEKERMAVVFRRACCAFHSGMNLAEVVVGLSEDERDYSCEVCVCVCLLLSLVAADLRLRVNVV